MIDIRQTPEYAKWFQRLRDRSAIAKISIRIRRVSIGNFGDTKSVGGGIHELRITHGPGYRIYFTHQGDQIVLLLMGGDKSSQSRDIEKAREILKGLDK